MKVSVSTLWLNIVFILSGHRVRCHYQFPQAATPVNTPSQPIRGGDGSKPSMAMLARWLELHMLPSYCSFCRWGRRLMGNHRGAYAANQLWSTGLFWGFLSSVVSFWSLWSSNGCFGGHLRGSGGNMLSNWSRRPRAKRGFERQNSWV